MEQQAQAERAQRFRALHASGTFVIANCWDGGSARILTALGFPALATSSGASAGTLGRLDGNVSLNEALAQARTICSVDVAARVRGPRERIRRWAGGNRQGHRACGRDRPGWRLHRRCHRPQGCAHLRSRLCHRTRCGRRRSGTQTSLPFHADRARRELSTRQTRSRRHDQAPAGFRTRRRGCVVRSRPSRSRRDSHRVHVAEQAREFHGGHSRQIVFRRGAGTKLVFAASASPARCIAPP